MTGTRLTVVMGCGVRASDEPVLERTARYGDSTARVLGQLGIEPFDGVDNG